MGIAFRTRVLTRQWNFDLTGRLTVLVASASAASGLSSYCHLLWMIDSVVSFDLGPARGPRLQSCESTVVVTGYWTY
jgi:hypothetical protein